MQPIDLRCCGILSSNVAMLSRPMLLRRRETIQSLWIFMGARSGQNSVYYFCPSSNYFYGVQHLVIFIS